MLVVPRTPLQEGLITSLETRRELVVLCTDTCYWRAARACSFENNGRIATVAQWSALAQWLGFVVGK